MSDDQLMKIASYMEILNVWLEMRQKGKTIIPYMEEHGYKKIAIYGMQMLGHRLIDELAGSGVSIEYVVDKQFVLGEFKLLSPDDDLPNVDVMIVTADYYYPEIKTFLEKKVDFSVISLRMLLGNAFHRIF